MFSVIGDDNKLTNIEEIEEEFATTTNEIKKTLCSNASNIDVAALIEQLRCVSATIDKKVPIFAPETFKEVPDIESLWQKLSAYWTFFDHDILKLVLKFTNCKEAKRVFDDFLSKIDPATIDDVDLIIHYKVYERIGFTRPLLRVKLKLNRFSSHKESVKRELSKVFNLKEYTLCLKGIKEGCVELMYKISKELKSYLLSYRLINSDVQYLLKHGITHLEIDNMEIDLISFKVTNH